MKLGLRSQLILSFSALVFVFLIGAGVTFYVVAKGKDTVANLYKDKNPIVDEMIGFKKDLMESKEYAFNWIYRGDVQWSKDSLIKIISKDYEQRDFNKYR